MGFNRIQDGKSIMYNDAGGTIVAGQLVPIGGDLIGVADNTSALAPGNNITVHLSGAYRGLPLKTGDTPNVGDKLYFNPVNLWLTTTASTYAFAGWCWIAPSIGTTLVITGTYTSVGLRLKL